MKTNHLLYFLILLISETFSYTCKKIANSDDDRFNSSHVQGICSTINGSQCPPGRGAFVNKKNHNFMCINLRGYDKCVCADYSITTHAIILVDVTGLNQKKFQHEVLFLLNKYWESVVQFLPNILIHTVFFHNKIVATTNDNPSKLFLNNKLPSQWEKFQNPNACVAMNYAHEWLNGPPIGTISKHKVLIYLGQNTPISPSKDFKCNYKPIQKGVLTYALKSNHKINLDYVERDYGHFHQCASLYLTKHHQNNTNNIKVIANAIVSVSDFVCYGVTSTRTPTSNPTSSPTKLPTSSPTPAPTKLPTSSPTPAPTDLPTSTPTLSPTPSPTILTSSPTTTPSRSPSKQPTSRTKSPTAGPTLLPTKLPTSSPTPAPTDLPTSSPTDGTSNPTTMPSRSPSKQPTSRTKLPTNGPTPAPTKLPTSSPTPAPTCYPTPVPTKLPTSSPTPAPTKLPTSSPTPAPTKLPTSSPTPAPTKLPTSSPTPAPTKLPTSSPTPAPTDLPTATPTFSPTPSPTNVTSNPTSTPSHSPSKQPTSRTKLPTSGPTPAPTKLPTSSPTPSPTKLPTSSPTPAPTKLPTNTPTPAPTKLPTSSPTPAPTDLPTSTPSFSPTPSPTNVTSNPTTIPSRPPSNQPTSLTKKPTANAGSPETAPPTPLPTRPLPPVVTHATRSPAVHKNHGNTLLPTFKGKPKNCISAFGKFNHYGETMYWYFEVNGNKVNENEVYIQVTGPLTKWFGIGLNSSNVGNTYTINVFPNGGVHAVQEIQVTPDHHLIPLPKQTVQILSRRIIGNQHTFELKRTKIGFNEKYFTFPSTATNIKVIYTHSGAKYFGSKGLIFDKKCNIPYITKKPSKVQTRNPTKKPKQWGKNTVNPTKNPTKTPTTRMWWKYPNN